MEQFVERLMQLSPFLVQCITYLVIFLGAIIEGIPPFGFLYPCWLLLCISGFLANIHLISLPIIITYAIVGAFIGEVFSYTLGKKYGMTFFEKTKKWIPISDSVFEKVRELTTKNLFIGMFLVKFYGGIRGFIPFMSGISKIKFSKFLLYSIGSSIIWAFSFILLGFILGESYVFVAKTMGTFLARGGIIAVSIGIFSRIMKSKYNIFNKTFTMISLISICSVFLLGLITQQYVNGIPLFTEIDLTIFEKIIQYPFLSNIMSEISHHFSFQSIGIIGIIIIFFLHRKKMLYYLSVFFSSIISCVFAFPIIKALIGKHLQGTQSISILNDFSYPSGYAMTSIVLFLLIRYVFQPLIKNKVFRYGSCCGAGIIGIIIGFATLQEYAYQTIDIIGGILLGIFVLTLNILIWKVIFQSHKDKKKEITLTSQKRILNLLNE